MGLGLWGGTASHFCTVVVLKLRTVPAEAAPTWTSTASSVYPGGVSVGPAAAFSGGRPASGWSLREREGGREKDRQTDRERERERERETDRQTDREKERERERERASERERENRGWQVLGFRVSGLGFRVWGFRFWASG